MPGAGTEQTRATRANLLTGSADSDTLYICAEGDWFPIQTNDILYCQSNNSIVTFVIKTDNEELNSTGMRRHSVTTRQPEHDDLLEWETYMTMKDLGEALATRHFCRIHNKYLVNMAHVRRLMTKYEGLCKVKLSNGEVLPVSASGKKEFLKMAGRL